MRNLIQLVGGVAVAGAVAAGSTAFTAGSGFFGGTSASAPVIVGGALSTGIVVTGATINTLVFNHNAAPSTIDSLNITLKTDANVAITNGTLKVTVTAGTGTLTEITCGYVASSTNAFVCTPGAPWTAITLIDGKYQEA
ncbi:hypothetical protein Acy02nite_19410 [Actinoplanes cyaneus]|uniref:Uncharacterized protein n=1 Tax=Actinoplanes cyaneus TaxID=52696 RepID=A0A919ILB2_9ACTN|nr:hypothetical protein [Actinoplanes cyaneus]MCW2136787.1 hypothetical protein [Actinoplanes cyaneus]GID64060.1 hypothetical protein Acy02nite_19410 [Actinoplanes cyaneus]